MGLNYYDYGRGLQNITFEFTGTKPNESVKPYGTFIAFDGKITGAKSSIIYIQGGDDKGGFAVNSNEPSPFYMTTEQRLSMMKILKGASETSDSCTISSQNGQIQEMAIAIYKNYCG